MRESELRRFLVTTATATRPVCPRCGSSSRAQTAEEAGTTPLPNLDPLANWWCDRCLGWLITLSPRPGRYAPDFEGPVYDPRYSSRHDPEIAALAAAAKDELEGRAKPYQEWLAALESGATEEER